MDLVLKYLPLIIFIYPILSWLDSRKRFTHNAEFYSDRAVSVKRYEEECSRKGIKDHEKSAFAQALAGTDKLGFRDIDIIKSKFPDALFVMINNLQKIRKKVSIEVLNGEEVFVAKKTLKTLQFRPFWYFILYFSSVPIIISNSLLVLLFNKLSWNLILVDANTYLFAQWASLIIGVGVAVVAAMKFINNEVLVSLIKDKKMVISKDEFENSLIPEILEYEI
ncbi:MAG: hypothetical protein A3F63_11240 [Pseudomonadales bacterium RIFCSPHIGHO2_12_FULL_40_16]|nr:MAG: hypothetical protein A3F63_11240 [Pseudomonadales bacterium RIFCSPHIGHO2_12_FULL_40_16]